MKNKGLSIKDSLSLKGVAIMMMLFYHLFRTERLYRKFNVNFAPFSDDFSTDVIVMFKICVTIFAFVSGYGLLTSIKKIQLTRKEITKWNITRLLNTMSGYYFAYIIIFIVTMSINQMPLKKYFKGSIAEGIFRTIVDFLGLSKLLSTPLLMGTWWYMSAAIFFILIIPILYWLSKKFGYLPIIVLVIAIPRFLTIGYPGGLNPYTFLIPLIMGMIFADYSLFEKLSDFITKNKLTYILTFFALMLCFIYYYYFYNDISVAKQWEFKLGFFPIAVICFLRFFVIRIPYLNIVLMFLGKHSMNIFLIHNFICKKYLRKFIYSFDNFILIWLVLLLISLGFSIALELLKKLIRYNKLIDKLKEVLINNVDKLNESTGK